MQQMEIHIKNLRLRTVIGVEDWERQREQDVVVNVWITFDGQAAAESDDLAETINYKAIKRQIMSEVEQAKFFLVEKLAAHILEIIMADPKALAAKVEIDNCIICVPYFIGS